jgi:hypothetical protein
MHGWRARRRRKRLVWLPRFFLAHSAHAPLSRIARRFALVLIRPSATHQGCALIFGRRVWGRTGHACVGNVVHCLSPTPCRCRTPRWRCGYCSPVLTHSRSQRVDRMHGWRARRRRKRLVLPPSFFLAPAAHAPRRCIARHFAFVRIRPSAIQLWCALIFWQRMWGRTGHTCVADVAHCLSPTSCRCHPSR